MTRSRSLSRSRSNPVKRVIIGGISVLLVLVGIWVVYKKAARQFNRAAGIMETVAGRDKTERWTLPRASSALLVRHQSHTNVVEALNTAHLKLRGERLKIHAPPEPFDYIVSPAHNGAVEVYREWDPNEPKDEADAMALATELSRELNTIVVVSLMIRVREDSGVYAVFENGQRRFRLKRSHTLKGFPRPKVFVERDGEEWAKQHGYVADPDDVLTGDNDAIPFGDANALTRNLGIDLSDAPEDPQGALMLEVTVRQDSPPQKR